MYDERDDGLYEYNPVTDKYYKISDRVTRNNSYDTKKYYDPKEEEARRQRQKVLEDRKIEKEYEWKQKIQKENAVFEAKQRYYAKSSLWKFFHRKIHPKNIDFDSLSVRSVERMYRGK